MIRILGHEYYGNPSFNVGYDRRCIAFVFPVDISSELIEQFKDADVLHVLGKKKEIVSTYRLTGWQSVEKVSSRDHEGIAIKWFTITLDEYDRLTKQIQDLEAENRSLTEENATLTDAILELAAIVGEEGGV